MNRTTQLPANDRDLIALAQRGDAAAVAALIRRHRGGIERVCHRMCRDATYADDVVQETYVAILRSLASYRGQARFLTWVYTLARTHRGRAQRRQTRELRRQERLLMFAGADRPEEAAPDELVARSETATAVYRAVGLLSSVDREILRLRVSEHLSAEAIAAQLNLTAPAVKTRLHRARALLRRKTEGVAGRGAAADVGPTIATGRAARAS